jgi:26S proteasome regulatory subunit N10
LALKHRQEKVQQQRIIIFVGSPLQVEESQLVQLGKRLKKNNVAVDVINFGEETTNTERLEAFRKAVDNNDNR